MGRDFVEQEPKKTSTIKIKKDSQLITDYALDNFLESFAYLRYLRMLGEIDDALEAKRKSTWDITSDEHRKKYYHKQNTKNQEHISHNLYYINKIKIIVMNELRKI